MEKPPEEIRSEIDDVREDLGETLEAIGDRVAPKKVIARAKADAAEKVGDVKRKLSPRRLAQRGADAVRHSVRSAVGSDGDASAGPRLPQVPASDRGQGRAVTATTRGQSKAVAQRAQGAASTLAGSVGDAPEAVRQRAEGNPVAAGLLAFAGGFSPRPCCRRPSVSVSWSRRRRSDWNRWSSKRPRWARTSPANCSRRP